MSQGRKNQNTFGLQRMIDRHINLSEEEWQQIFDVSYSETSSLAAAMLLEEVLRYIASFGTPTNSDVRIRMQSFERMAKAVADLASAQIPTPLDDTLPHTEAK